MMQSHVVAGLPGAQTAIVNMPPQRKYLPTLPDLVDRLTIVQMKMIFIPEKVEEYRHERELILHDIDLMMKESWQRGIRAWEAWRLEVGGWRLEQRV